MDQKYYAHYKGIVVQNNDPEMRGRVKVWVPHVNATMYEEWNQLASDKYLTDITSAQHVFLGQNVLSNLTPILLRLKEKLPWAELSQPLIGSGSSGFFQSSKTIESSVDAAQAISNQMLGGGIAKISYGAEELTGIHDKCRTNEALQGQLENNLAKSRAGVNQLTQAIASKYAGGGSSDVSQKAAPPSTNETIQPLKHQDTGKTVTPLGPLGEQIDSDACGSSQQHAFHRAPVRDDFYQQGGQQANNNIANPHTHLFRAPNHENKARGSLSIPDVGAVVWVFFDGGNSQYPVINGVLYGAEDYRGTWETHNQGEPSGQIDKVQQGYSNERGQGNSPDYPSNYQNRDPSDIASASDVEDNLYRNKWSIIERGGSFEIVSTFERELVRLAHFGGSFIEFNKLCTSRLATGNDQLLVLKDQFSNVHGNMTIQINKDYDAIVLGDYYRKVGDIRKWKPHSDKIKQLMRPIHNIKRLFEIQRTQKSIDTANEQSQSGSPAACPVCNQGKQFYQAVTLAPDTLTETDKLVCGEGKDWLDTGIAIVAGDFQLRPLAGAGGNMYQEVCWCCGGSGESPSTQDGTWAPEPLKDQITSKLISMTNELGEEERQFGRAEHREGGNVIDVIAKNIHRVIGLTFNDFESYRKDLTGKLVPYGIKVEKGGVYPQYAPSPLVESVHVDDLPGGDYDLTVCSKYCVRVGGGGIRMQTTGNLTVGGQIVTIAGEQLLFSARSEIAFDAGSRFDVEADIITLRPRVVERGGKRTQQVGVFGSLNIAQNLVVRGGTHVEGEVSLQHITAPREWHLTEVEPQITRASIKDGYRIGRAVGVDTGGDYHELEVWSVCAPDSVEVDPHVHWKADPAWTLMETYDDVRQVGERLNEVGVVSPHTVKSCDRFLEQCYPEKTKGRIEVGTHFNPDQPPDGNPAAAENDPLLDGYGDGTQFTDTAASKQRQRQAEDIAQSAANAAGAYQTANTPKVFDRAHYDVPIIT